MPIIKETENSYGLTNKKYYQSIANSLRSLYRSDEAYFPEDMAACLESESSNPEFNSKNIKKGVTFFGVTGECVPGEEIDGIEWPEDNYTHLWLELESHRCRPTLRFMVTGTVVIYWGDGSNTEVTAGGERVSQSHQYNLSGASKKIYDITIVSKESDYVTFSASYGAIEILDLEYHSSLTMLQLGLYDKAESQSLGASYALRRVKILQDLGKNSVFRGNPSLVEVSFSERVTELPEYTFNNNFNLRSITFPKELVNFKQYALSSCRNLKTVVFEGDVKSLPQSLFSGCWSVKEYWFKNVTQVPVLGNYVFNEMPSYCKIYVPSEMVKTFKENSQWGAYANQIYELPSP